MMRKKTWMNGERLLWSVFIGLCFMLIYGYSINCGDQEEHLPYVYKLINPSLYPVDYIVPVQVSHFTIRYYFAHLIYLLQFILPLTTAVLIVYFSSLVAVVYFTGRIAELCSGWQYSFVIAPAISLILLRNFTVGGNSIFDNQLTGGCIASALAIIAFYQAIRNRYILSAAIAGIASLFQVLVGIHIFSLILIIFISGIESVNIKRIVIATVTFALFSAPVLIPVLINQSVKLSPLQEKFYYKILFNFRNPHHYIPSFFPLNDYLKTIIVWIVALFAALEVKNQWRKIFLAPLIFAIIICCIYTVGFINFNIYGLGKLQWFKITGWITLLSSVPITTFIGSKLNIRIFLEKIFSSSRKLLIPSCILLIIILFNTAFIPIQKFKNRYRIGNYIKSDLTKMHEWIADSTNLNCVVLPMPEDESFLCEAKRNIPVGYKAIIHEPFFMIPWYNNFYAVYGTGIADINSNQTVLQRATEIYSTRPDSVITSFLKIDYRIWDEGKCPVSTSKDKSIIHREGSLILAKFNN